jgi:DNA mismatch repair protein MutL
MGRVRKLDDNVIGLIAAGEVVEGPWSVVKELLENSLDAEARRIDVSLGEGGFREIKVADDGCGMDEADLRLAFERFATSKVRRAEDLDAVGTLGFRGEALPAIAAVAHVTVYTRAAGASRGHKAVVEGGRTVVTPEGAPPGTTVIVRDLFAAVPARRKFAGQPASEWRRAAEVFKRLALAYPEPTFSLTKDGRLQYTAAGNASRRQRLGEILGWELVDRLVPVEAEEGAYALEAYLAPAATSYSTTAHVYTVVNGRPARARALFKAVMAAYEGRLERARYPVAVVYLRLPEEEVDVNVHPRKEEVRLASGGVVTDFVSRSLREALAAAGVAVRAESFAPPAAAPLARSRGPQVTADVRNAVEGYLRRHGLMPSAAAAAGASAGAEAPSQTLLAAAAEPEPEAPAAGAVEVLGQFNDTYVLARHGRDLVVIDQHTAHERVLYDRLAGRGAAGKQTLLLPVTVNLGAAPAADLKACLPALRELGFEVEEFGGGAFVVRGHPADVRLGSLEAFLARVIEEFVEEGRPAAAEELREAVLKGAACHGAVRAGERLDVAEMEALAADLFASPTPDVCPHGRPTRVNLPARELERLFKR